MLTCANIKKRKKELLLAFAYILTAEEGFVNRGNKNFCRAHFSFGSVQTLPSLSVQPAPAPLLTGPTRGLFLLFEKKKKKDTATQRGYPLNYHKFVLRTCDNSCLLTSLASLPKANL